MKYKYSARDLSGKMEKGVIEANSSNGAADTLRESKLTPISINIVKPGIDLQFLKGLTGKVSSSDVTNFTRQLSTMITAGLPLTDALNLLKVQSAPSLSVVISQMLLDVQSGQPLSSAMSKYPKIFPKVYTALVKAAEAAGVMEQILNRLAENSEKAREFRGKVSGAMIYPVIILVAMVGIMILMMVVGVPKMTALYADFGAELPWSTKLLMATSDFMVHQWWLMIIIVAGLFFGGRYFLGTKKGRMQWDTFMYKIPVIGTLAKETMLTEITRTMSLLLGSGISVVEALNIVADASGNELVRLDLLRIAHQVEKGFPVSISFSESPIFPIVVGQMVAVGEETGKMDDVLAKLSHYFETGSEEKVKGLTTAIEPIILIVLAIGVGFLMFSIVMPIYSITNEI
jgi:type II secretory pathway component PulF